MNWFALAIVGHFANAAAFLIDKVLLSAALKQSGTYAALIGSFSFVTLFAAPWVNAWPDVRLLPKTIAFGALFVFALWAFFEALRRAEVSRVVPIVGSLVPVFTLLGTSIAFGEQLSPSIAIGFAMLVFSTFLLTRGGKTHAVDLSTLAIALLAASLFAASSVLGKAAYSASPFLGVFIASRVSAGIVGLSIILFSARIRNEIAGLFKKRRSGANKNALPLAVFGQLTGSAGFVLVHLALAEGSAAIVNALQASQYALLVLVAWFGGKRLARALRETMDARVIIVKSFAIVLVSVGLFLIGSNV